MLRHAFCAMGTEIELLVEDGDAGDAAAVEAEFERLEQTMSRFRPGSELSRLNDEGAIDASDDLLRVVELALDARERTHGRFDPTVHDALVAAGYDRPFETVPPTLDEPRKWQSVTCGGGVRVQGSRIELDPGVRLDLGGIGKGYAAERAADLLGGTCLVNAGGDVAVRGDRVWPVAVDESLTLGLERGGLATSGRDRRRWQRGGEERHHLIDPATAAPAATDLLRVTVVAGDAVEAEVLAKALFLGARPDADAVLVYEDGRVERTGALA